MSGTVAILFERFGPYHVARLEASAQAQKVVAVQVTKRDATYAWDVLASNTAFESVTLFSQSRQAYVRSGLVSAVSATLDRLSPVCVAVPGWSAPYAIAALRWAVKRGVAIVMMSDSTEDDAPRFGWRESVKRRLVHKCGAALVAGQRHIRYVERLGMPPERIFTGYDVVDNGHFEAGARAARATASGYRDGLGLPPRYFLASSRFVEKKSLLRLLEAFARYRRGAALNGWDLVLLGDGELRGRVKQRIHELGISKWVQLPGFKQYNDLPVYYGLAGAFVHASTVEQWGLVVNEAMAAGLPVLVSDRCGCAPDLVEESRNGFTFDPYDVDALTRLMDYVASDRCDLEAMGKASQEIIASWTPNTFAQGLAKAVETACATPRPRPGILDRLLLEALIRR